MVEKQVEARTNLLQHSAFELGAQKNGNGRKTFDSFLTERDLQLKPGLKEFCLYGIDLLGDPRDPLHDVGHVERIFADLEKFVVQDPSCEIDYDVLMPAIAWHDVWRALNPANNLWSDLSTHLREGRQAGLLTWEQMIELGFDKTLADNVSYCIKRHTHPQLLRRDTVESRLLRDLDFLESWSSERLLGILIQTEKRLPVKAVRVLVGKMMLRKLDHKYYFGHFQKEAEKRSPIFVKQIESLFF